MQVTSGSQEVQRLPISKIRGFLRTKAIQFFRQRLGRKR
jgi:hypothetical protein